jgi:predicted O-methyltransferase YrrM/SAM-dependent methyltransferase
VAWGDVPPPGLSPLEQAGFERRRALLAALLPASGARLELGIDGGVWQDGRLAAADASADVFFAQDGLDRIDDTERFLDEIHRVLRPGGTLVATATNADAYLFAQASCRYGATGDRPALMGFRELRAALAPRFEVVAACGCNTALHPVVDRLVADVGVARAWASQLDDRPELASDIVIVGRRRDGTRSGRRRTDVIAIDDPSIGWEGPWVPVPLAPDVSGRMATGADASACTVDVDGTDVLVFLWSHPWSGHATVEVDGVARLVDLYSPASGFRRVHVGGLAPGPHRLCVRGTRLRHPRSQGDQTILHKVIAYDDRDHRPGRGEEREMDHINFSTRPGRFGVVYTTLAHMTGAERVLLYALTFGLRPARTLEIGTFRGGSALVICAALDDVGAGTLTCVDPVPQISPDHWSQISHRATLFAEPSPDVLPRAMASAGGPFDMALIDGHHGYENVVRDIEGVLPVLAPEAHVVFHDAHHREVAQAIDRMLVAHADALSDAGMLSTERGPEEPGDDGRPVVWGGIRLVRYHRPR